MKQKKLIFHLVYRLGIGGLETLLVNMINKMSGQDFTHKIICLTYTDGLEVRLKKDVEVLALHKSDGNDPRIHLKLAKLFRKYKPDILHTYNIPTIEYHFTAWLMGVKGRIHAEHGRDASDPEGKNRKYNILRKLLSPFIGQYIAVSHDLYHWLRKDVYLSEKKVSLILNGVDTVAFQPLKNSSTQQDSIKIGIIGRLDPVKDHKTLFDAILQLKQTDRKFTLYVVGDGPDKKYLEDYVRDLHLREVIIFLGARDDIAIQLKQLDIFVLSSIAEGIPITLIEAMSCGLPTVTTNVGGIPEVVVDNKTGKLVPPKQPTLFAEALIKYIDDGRLRSQHGSSGRKRIEALFSLEVMVEKYTEIYRKIDA